MEVLLESGKLPLNKRMYICALAELVPGIREKGSLEFITIISLLKYKVCRKNLQEFFVKICIYLEVP